MAEADLATWGLWGLSPNNTFLFVLALLVLGLSALYAARPSVHRLIRTGIRAGRHLLRMAAQWLRVNAAELRERNRLVLLAHGREELGQRIERELERIDTVVRRDLQEYPALQRRLLEMLARFEEDYQQHGEVPPVPPEWTKVVTAVAKIKPGGDPVVKRIVADMQKTVNDAHDAAMREYREAFSARHRKLARLMPVWRGMNGTLASFDKNLADLRQRAAATDENIEKYRQMHRQSDQAERTLMVSASLQFVLAILVLLGAAGAAVLNFSLIVLPLSEVMDTNRYLGRVPVADLAAGIVIALEVLMGLFLMEALRVTHLFPRVSYLPDQARRRLAIVALAMLVLFAGLEVGLALLHDKIAATLDPLINSSLLIRRADALLVSAWLGFLLPFALAFTAIPLEAFLYSLRTVAGALLVLGFRLTAFALQLLGTLLRNLGGVLIALYDGIIFIPLSLERLLKPLFSRGSAAKAAVEQPPV